MFLTSKSGRRRLAEAEAARRDRQAILAAWSRGEIARRDLLRWGIVGAGGALLQGLSPLARSARADVPTGTLPSPVPSGLAFTQPLPRLAELPRQPERKIGKWWRDVHKGCLPYPSKSGPHQFDRVQLVKPQLLCVELVEAQ